MVADYRFNCLSGLSIPKLAYSLKYALLELSPKSILLTVSFFQADLLYFSWALSQSLERCGVTLLWRYCMWRCDHVTIELYLQKVTMVTTFLFFFFPSRLKNHPRQSSHRSQPLLQIWSTDEHFHRKGEKGLKYHACASYIRLLVNQAKSGWQEWIILAYILTNHHIHFNIAYFFDVTNQIFARLYRMPPSTQLLTSCTPDAVSEIVRGETKRGAVDHNYSRTLEIIS